MSNLFSFFEDISEEETRGVFSNGGPDFWDEMPEFEAKNNSPVILPIEFKNLDDLMEFYTLIDYQGTRKLPNLCNTTTAWIPPKDSRRNSALVFVHENTYLANKDKYELASLSDIQQ